MRFISVIILCFLSFSSQASQDFVNSLEKQNWSKASKVKDPSYKILATWLRLTNEPKPNFYELTQFLEKHPNWPKQDLLKRKIEESDFSNCKTSDLLSWFEKHPPKTNVGRKKYISLIDDKKLKSHYIKLVWADNSFSKTQEQEFINSYKAFLTQEDHLHRINHLLFNHLTDQAIRMLPYIEEKSRSIYQTRIALQQGKLKSTNLKSIGVLHELAHSYELQKNEEKLIATLKLASEIGGKYQFYFWNMKSRLIRNLVQEKKYQTAYLFASTHGHLNAKELSEAEWLAGWIALRFLNQPQAAIKHFTNVYNNVKLPVSLARGSYWLGRAYEKLNDKEKSDHWYKIASQYYIAFYGQLAVCKTNNCALKLPAEPTIDHKSKELFNNNHLVKAALLLEKTKYSHLVQELLFKAIEHSQDSGEIAMITKIGFQMDQHHLSVESAKQASYKDIHIIASNYPVSKHVYKDHPLDHALVMALIRQESVFNHRAVSSAGAMGMMQMMPHVAKETASKMKVKFHKSKLTNDPHFNTMLGTCHLEKLIKNYNGSYILTIAAYNAGDKAAYKWIGENGDPRLMKDQDDIIDWMEKITYYETRNYVQRVLEGKSIYNIVINKQDKLSILTDLSSFY